MEQKNTDADNVFEAASVQNEDKPKKAKRKAGHIVFAAAAAALCLFGAACFSGLIKIPAETEAPAVSAVEQEPASEPEKTDPVPEPEPGPEVEPEPEVVYPIVEEDEHGNITTTYEDGSMLIHEPVGINYNLDKDYNLISVTFDNDEARAIYEDMTSGPMDTGIFTQVEPPAAQPVTRKPSVDLNGDGELSYEEAVAAGEEAVEFYYQRLAAAEYAKTNDWEHKKDEAKAVHEELERQSAEESE